MVTTKGMLTFFLVLILGNSLVIDAAVSANFPSGAQVSNIMTLEDIEPKRTRALKKGKKSGYGKGGKKGGYGYDAYYVDNYRYGKKGGYGSPPPVHSYYGGGYGGKKGGYYGGPFGPPPPGPYLGGKKGGYRYGGPFGPPPPGPYLGGKKGGYGYGGPFGPPPPGPYLGGKKGGYRYGGPFGPPPPGPYFGGKKGGYGYGGPFGPPPPGPYLGGKKGGYGYGGPFGPLPPGPYLGGKKGGYGYGGPFGPPPPGHGGPFWGPPGHGGPFWGPPGHGGHWPGPGGGHGHGYWGDDYYYYDDYYYNDCDDDGDSDNDGDEPSDPKTPSLVQHDDGSIGCFPENADGTLEYHGQTSLNLLKFSYSMKTGDGVDVQKKAREIENIFAGILAEKLDCSKFSGHTKTHARQLIEDNRRLAIISIDPEPADNIDTLGSHCDQTCCNSNCHSISSAMTVYTDGENDHIDVCELLAALHDYTGKYDGSIEGVISLGIDPSTAEANGMSCYPEVEDDRAPLNPALAVNTQTEEQKSLADEFVFPLMALILAMVAMALYVKKRRRDRRLVEEREEQMRLKAIEDARYLDDGFKDNQFYEDDHAYQSYGYGRATLNSVNVHKCTSAQCKICSQSRGTEFVPLDSVSKWIEKRSLQDDDVPPPPPPPPPEEIDSSTDCMYDSKAVYTNQRDLGPIGENEAYDEPGHIQMGDSKETGSI